MNVILTEDFPLLGYVGDQVAVRPGYARNFLIPRGIAIEAFSHNAKLLAHRLAGVNAKRAKLKAESEESAKRFQGLTLEFTLKMASEGRSFGSVTLRDIEAALKERNLVVDRRQIRLNDVIKRPGSYTAHIKLHSEVSVDVPVQVTSEAPPAKAAESGEGAKRRSRAKKGEEAPGEESATEPAAEASAEVAAEE